MLNFATIKKLLLLSLVFFQIITIGATIKGKILGNSNEPLIGAMIQIESLGIADYAGLDGSYKLKLATGTHQIKVSYFSYQDYSVTLTLLNDQDEIQQDFLLKPETYILDELVINVASNKETEVNARKEEKDASSVVNVVSAKAIEQSPDITVANVVQRVSGLTVERNNNGDGQYAIVRGMDKRYNYTLVNGIKIPSPDNENRYVPLDIFPAELLSRLVVSKSLTPDMEGDAIGGVIDLKMKEAPVKQLINVSAASGYNEMFLDRKYDYFDPSTVMRNPPRETFGRIVTHNDLAYGNFNHTQITPLPNTFASVVYGDRFVNNKLGVLLAGSFQNSYRGSDRLEFRISNNNREQILPKISELQKRKYSIQQRRTGFFNKLDYKFNDKNHLNLSNSYMNFLNLETRHVWIDELRSGDPTLEYNTRGQTNLQQIYNSTLQGDHEFNSKLSSDWSLVYSYASQNMPDNSLLRLVRYYPKNEPPRWVLDGNFIRIWEFNNDRDYAAYYNINYIPTIKGQDVEFKYGGLYRIKDRVNRYDSYSFKPNPGVQTYEPYESDLAEITFRTTGGGGDPTNVLNYESYENIFANYGQFKFIRWNTQFLGGVRVEHTQQGYTTTNPNFPEGEQNYWSVLPSMHVKYMPNSKTNIRTSYFRSISRPSFLEIIPYRRPDYEEIFSPTGNPSLKHVEADNFDFRYELFPTPTDQLLIGAFYKRIKDAIEYAVVPGGVAPNVYNSSSFMPVNFGLATNYGFELDYTKYIKNFGIRLNYTFTLSNIESIKRTWGLVTADNINQISDLQQTTDGIGIGDSTFISVTQNRPLQGQSMHLGNLSLLYKNKKKGIDAQLSLVYTGERIAIVAVGLDNDFWQKAFTQLDFSLEKTFGTSKKFVLFIKINNILDSPFELYVKKPHLTTQSQVAEIQKTYQDSQETLVRRDFYNRNYMLGMRYKF